MTRGKRTARVEGAATPIIPLTAEEQAITDAAKAFPPAEHTFDKPTLHELDGIVAAYKAKFDDWSDIALWPLESGLKHMSEKLKG